MRLLQSGPGGREAGTEPRLCEAGRRLLDGGYRAPDRLGSRSPAPFGPRAPGRAGVEFMVPGFLGLAGGFDALSEPGLKFRP